MADTSIRVSAAAKRRLDLHKREDESYDDVIKRLTTQDKWIGFGALADTEADTREGMQAIRENMRDGAAEHIEQ